MSQFEGARVYNLFPRLVGQVSQWPRHFDRIKGMGFNWVYLNPLSYPGFSGSLYSVKDYYAYNPLFFEGSTPKEAEKELRQVLAEAHRRGLKVMMDLVINHTAIDAVLAQEHPEWYQKNPDGTTKNPSCKLENGEIIVWGDLAQIDNELKDRPKDRQALWDYWLALVKHSLSLGFDGFRCDAAYHVPSALWKYLIEATKADYPQVRFFGETLGCTAKETIAVADAGFDWIFNSSKYWNFEEEWFLKEFRKVVGVAPSIAFPESHDTPRLATETDGNQSTIKMRYAFAAFLSAGIMIPVGYEYGFRTPLNVVTTLPHHWETPSFDLTSFIALVNEIKKSHRVFNEDRDIEVITPGNSRVFAFIKESADGREKALIVINKDTEGWQKVEFPDLFGMMDRGQLKDVSPGHRMEEVPCNFEYHLPPGEVKVFIAE
ncbi:MAG: alpha-amylase family glycosyl hydrolase [Bacteroidota bacterium]